MKEEQFSKAIFEATGKEIGKDYGFMMGTETPFSEHIEFQTGHLVNGFIVWKRERNFPNFSTENKTFKSEGVEKNLENIINFLNGK